MGWPNAKALGNLVGSLDVPHISKCWVLTLVLFLWSNCLMSVRQYAPTLDPQQLEIRTCSVTNQCLVA